jgi:hypothetical protein
MLGISLDSLVRDGVQDVLKWVDGTEILPDPVFQISKNSWSLVLRSNPFVSGSDPVTLIGLTRTDLVRRAG